MTTVGVKGLIHNCIIVQYACVNIHTNEQFAFSESVLFGLENVQFKTHYGEPTIKAASLIVTSTYSVHH